MIDQNRNSHISHMIHLLSSVPAITEEQLAIYLSRQYDYDDTKSFYRSFSYAERNKIMWAERVGDITLFCREPDVMRQLTAIDFPFAFWLYLSLGSSAEMCQYALHPFMAQFSRPQKDGSETIVEVAIFDCKGSKLALSFANEVGTSTEAKMRLYHLRLTDMKRAFTRMLILKNMPEGFLESRDFELLQGVGFSCFFKENSYHRVPTLIHKSPSIDKAWERISK